MAALLEEIVVGELVPVLGESVPVHLSPKPVITVRPFGHQVWPILRRVAVGDDSVRLPVGGGEVRCLVDPFGVGDTEFSLLECPREEVVSFRALLGRNRRIHPVAHLPGEHEHVGIENVQCGEVAEVGRRHLVLGRDELLWEVDLPTG